MNKPKHPEELEPEEDEEEDLIQVVKPKGRIQSQIILGDLAVLTTGSMPSCKKLVKSLLKDRDIRSYLDIHKQKKLFSIPLGVG